MKHTAEERKGDRELCMATVAKDWKEAAEEMKGDRELCMAAVAQNGCALQHAGQRAARRWCRSTLDDCNRRTSVMVHTHAPGDARVGGGGCFDWCGPARGAGPLAP